MSVDKQAIEVFYGNLVLDLGAASIPRILARYWPHLVHGEDQLVDWEYAVLLQVLILRDDQDFELRAENLPLRSAERSIEKTKTKLRRMGLLFTQRIYYPARPGKPPAMRCQRWDMRSLFYNLELIARQWLAKNNKLADEWALRGRRGKKPVYAFPSDFKHETVLPPDVALDLARGVFYPAPEEWVRKAIDQLSTITVLPTGLDSAGRLPTDLQSAGRQALPTDLESVGRAPTDLESAGHLFNTDSDSIDSDSDGGGEGNTPQVLGSHTFDSNPAINGVFVEFANRCNDPKYWPSQKERRAVQSLFADGFALDTEILPGIEKAFARAKTPPRTFMYCVRVIRQNRVEVSGNDYAKPPAQPLEIPLDLAPAAEILAAAGYAINEPTLARLRLMADRADQAAHRAGSTGAQWLSDALRTGLGVSKNGALVNYADSVLNSWIQNGKQQPIKKTTTKRGRNAKPTVAAPASGSSRWPSDSD